MCFCVGLSRTLKRREKHDQNEQSGSWVYEKWMGNDQALMFKQGGQGNNDIKERWFTRTPGAELRFIFEAKQYGFVAFEGIKPEMVNDDKSIEIWYVFVGFRCFGK